MGTLIFVSAHDARFKSSPRRMFVLCNLCPLSKYKWTMRNAVRFLFFSSLVASAQQTAKTEFEVASVRQSRPEEQPYTNFPLGPGPEFKSGGYLVARNMPLLKFIEFAYKPLNYQMVVLRSEMPSWSNDVGFDIEARSEGNPSEGNPSKDEMRFMMQSLLASRFKMVMHHESREAPVFDLVLAKANKIGPRLKHHRSDDPNCVTAPLPQNDPDGYSGRVCGEHRYSCECA